MSITLTTRSLKQFPPWVGMPAKALAPNDKLKVLKFEGNRIASSFFAQKANSGNAAPLDNTPLPHGTGRGLRGSSTTTISGPKQDQEN